MAMASGIDGSLTSIFWKRRTSALILLEMLAVFLVGGRADTAQAAAGKCRLQQVGGIHGTAGSCTCTDHGMDFVDEHDGAGAGLDLLDHGLEAFLEIAAVARAGEQHAHVEHVDGAVLRELPAPRH